MAHIIIKSDERCQQEDFVRKSFGVASNDKKGKEITEMISARSMEAYKEMKQMGSRKYY